jgi:hypothetical protein
MTLVMNDEFEYAALSQAAYASLPEGITGTAYVSALSATNGADMSVVQAQQFADAYTVVDQQRNTVSGFSATLFQKNGQYTLATRGSENFFTGSGLVDWVAADIGQIGKYGTNIGAGWSVFA